MDINSGESGEKVIYHYSEQKTKAHQKRQFSLAFMGMTMKALARITLVALLVISFSVTIYADGFDGRTAHQEEEYGFFDGLVDAIVIVLFIVLLGLPILALLGGLVAHFLYETQCTKCRNFFARKLIAKTKLEPNVYKYKIRCKLCGYELEKIEEDIQVGPIL